MCFVEKIKPGERSGGWREGLEILNTVIREGFIGGMTFDLEEVKQCGRQC